MATHTSARCSSSEDANAAAEEAELRQGGVAEHRDGVERGEAEVGVAHGLEQGGADERAAGERGVAPGDADGEHPGHPALVLDQHVVEVGGHAAEERRPVLRVRVAVGGRPATREEALVAREVVLHHRLVHEADAVAPGGARLVRAGGQGFWRGPVQRVSPDVEAGAGEERAPDTVQAEPSGPEDVSELVGVDVVVAEVVEHLRELHEGEVLRRRRRAAAPAAVEEEAHGVHGGGAAVAGHVAVEDQHVGRVAHHARHSQLHAFMRPAGRHICKRAVMYYIFATSSHN